MKQRKNIVDDVAYKLAELRKLHSKPQLAELLGTDHNSIWRWTKKPESMRLGTAFKILKLYDELIGYEGEQ